MADKVITSFDYPPIPIRTMDWSAHMSNDEPNDDGQMTMGHGATESDAILDLHQALCDERDECPCDRDRRVDAACCAAGMCVREDDTTEPCTESSKQHGCSCTMESSHSASIDPPEPIVDRHCPLHGNAPDPDDAYDRMRDERDEGNW